MALHAWRCKSLKLLAISAIVPICTAARQGSTALSAWLDREFSIIIFDSEGRKYYHAPFMSGPAAVHRIEDPFEFARAANQCSGQLTLAALPRLQDRLSGNDGIVSYTVNGGQDERDRLLLELQVAADLPLRCDRCLMPMIYPLALNSKVLLARPGEMPQDDGDPDAPEWIEAGQELDLLELIEDEILLGLPLAVRHDPENCSPGRVGLTGAKQAPFAGLATLLESGRRNKQ